MHAETIVKRILGVIASLLAAVLWQLFCHFMGWTQADNTFTAVKAAVTVWGLLIAFSSVAEVFNLGDELDLVFLFGGGAFFWLSLQLIGVPDTIGFWGFFLIGMAHFVIAFGGKKALFLKAPLKGQQQ